MKLYFQEFVDYRKKTNKKTWSTLFLMAITIGDITVKILHYAGDIVLLSDSPSILQTMIDSP